MLFVGINAKFIHSNLAIRYLAKMDAEASYREFSIQDRPETVARALFESGETAIFFSCYIWNIEFVLKTCEILKKANSKLRLGLGGPEAAFRAEELLTQTPFLDFVMTGEGEMAVSPLAEAFKTGNFSKVPGLYYRSGESIKNPMSAVETDLEKLPFPYDEAEIRALKDRIVYYETSRGCPYRCAFCLSGSGGSLRFLPVERVEKELSLFESLGVPLVKFIDRTFNADRDRALAIIEGIKSRGAKTCYHFEIRAESLTEELIKSLQTAPKGMFQLEIGVQSTNPETLEKINRKPDFNRLSSVVRRLGQNKNLHLHLDLIAGLPGETLKTFIQSFEDVMKLSPDDLQLGFLKKLHGAELFAPDSEFWSFPPYEVVKSDAMSYEDILLLKGVEEMLERYYNSGAFSESISYILNTYYPDNTFEFFRSLAEFLGGNLAPKSQKTQFEDLYQFAKESFDDAIITEKHSFDYAKSHRDRLSIMKSGDFLKKQAFA